MRQRAGNIWHVCILLAAIATSGYGERRSPAEQFCDHVLNVIHRTRKQIPRMTTAAELAAERLLRGGNLFAAGTDRGFNLEALNRAGGMMATKLLGKLEEVKPDDVVLLSFTSQNTAEDRELAARLKERGALVIGFGSPHHVGAHHGLAFLFDNFAPRADCILHAPGYPHLLAPTSAVGNAINLWTFTAELVAACTRRGKMPTMWQSVMVEEARERNALYRGKNFHDSLRVEPVPAGRLARCYLEELSRLIRLIRAQEIDAIRQAADTVVETVRSGGNVYLYIIGHMPPDEVCRSGDTGLFQLLPTGVRLREKVPSVGKGDVIIGLVYAGVSPELWEFAQATGARVVWILAPTDGTEKVLARGDMVINQHWVLGDALVEVPGYDVKILPPSAITQLTIYWGLVGETASRLPRDRGS